MRNNNTTKQIENQKPKTRLENEKYIGEWVKELWLDFNESEEKRQTVLGVFDEAINERFVSKPEIVNWFKDVKDAFLESEAIKNEK